MAGQEMGRGPKLRPWEVKRLTLSEVVLYLRDDHARDPSGAPCATTAEVEEYIRRVRSLSPRERLELAREGRL